MLIQDEKRDHPRISMGTAAFYSLDNCKQHQPCTVKEISATGISLIAAEKIMVGGTIVITISPGKAITPPLIAYIEVLRVTSHEGSGYEIGCRIIKILDEHKIEI